MVVRMAWVMRTRVRSRSVSARSARPARQEQVRGQHFHAGAAQENCEVAQAGAVVPLREQMNDGQPRGGGVAIPHHAVTNPPERSAATAGASYRVAAKPAGFTRMAVPNGMPAAP